MARLARIDALGILHHVGSVLGRAVFKRICILSPKANVVEAAA